MTMHPLLRRIESFSAIEEFLDFFKIEYQADIVHVNRLHILKRFNQYLARTPISEDADETTAWDTCRAFLTQAHDDFIKSNAAQEKVFKVFQEQDGKSISLDSLKVSLTTRGEKAK